MPKIRSKCRVVFLYGTRHRELFSVAETSDGLSIFLKKEINHSFKETPLGKNIKNDRISVHNSRNSNGNLIKRTTEFSDGDISESYLFIKNSKENIFAHIFSKFCTKFSERFYSKPNKSDFISVVGQCKRIKGFSLIFHIFIARNNEKIPICKGHTFHVIRFKNWKIVVYYCVSNFIETEFGYALFPSTSAPLLNKNREFDFHSDGVDSIKHEEIDGYLFKACELMRDGTYSSLHAFAGEEVQKLFKNYPIWFFPSEEMLEISSATGWGPVAQIERRR